jgi:hypothetical protein
MPKSKGSPAPKSKFTSSNLATEVDDEEPIFIYGGLQKYVFYASLSFFDQTRPTQMTDYVVPRDDTPVRSLENNNTTKLLDQLALLFARFKLSRLPLKSVTDGVDPSSTGQNVTAAALQRPQDQPWTIHLTKNDGPLIFDNWSDKAFLKKIAAWYNKLEPERSLRLRQKDKIWQELQGFWLRRTSYYFDKLKEMRECLMYEFKSRNGDFLDLLLRVYGKCDASDVHGSACELCQAREGHVKADFEHVQKLLGKLEFDDDTEEGVRQYVQYLWFKDDLVWKRKYTKIHHSGRGLGPGLDWLDVDKTDKNNRPSIDDIELGRKRVTRVNQFRAAVKYLSLTCTPKRALERLSQFQTENKDVKLRFNFVDAKPVQPIRAQAIVDALNNTWSPEMTDNCTKLRSVLERTISSLHSKDKPRDFIDDSGQVRRTKGEGIHRYFHCELQMLDKFLEADDVYAYFECSKLSCYLCWCVLVGSKTKYRTNYTHCKIGISSAFPFTYSEGRKEKFLVLADALKHIENHLSKYVAKKARLGDDKYYLTAHAGVSDTYLEYTTSGHEDGIQEPQGGEGGDDAQGSAEASNIDFDWDTLDQMLRDRTFDSKSLVSSKLERKAYTAVKIPQVGEPELVHFTAYNLSGWVASWYQRFAFPITRDGQKLWYPDYFFEAYNGMLNAAKPTWDRYALPNHYYADICSTSRHELDLAQETTEAANKWWLRETGLVGMASYVMLDVYIWAFESGEVLTQDDVQSVVSLFKKFARDALEKRSAWKERLLVMQALGTEAEGQEMSN